MANDIMAEEMQTEKKVAFANRKYNNEDKRKKEEEELEQLIAEQKGESVESTQEAEPTGAEERSFKNVTVIFVGTCKIKKNLGKISLNNLKVS